MGDRQEVPSLPTASTSSSSSTTPPETKRSAEQDAQDLRKGDDESPRTGTKQNRNQDDHDDHGGMLIGYTVDEEADLEVLVRISRCCRRPLW